MNSNRASHSHNPTTVPAATAPFKMPLFSMGQIVATSEVLALLERIRMPAIQLLQRHVTGDFGDLCSEDIEANQNAVRSGARIFSSYLVEAEKVWVITDARDGRGHRAVTTLLLPREY